MITRAEISEFCKKNKIKEPWFNPNDKKDTYAIISMSDIDYFRKFYKRRPSDLWINLDTDDNKTTHHYTEFYDPKLKQLKKNLKSLLTKNITILKKKAELELDFKE